ncbi:ELM1/GtrOC1 family putative glycosyltransferase [uncultured Desulfuromusa sp.]|uniref:ELM1/GtrOC1 family putative glycosyltransferase n=1 Tax=uncultured Desulfuromusa sp. TaxID=219183 RepID=UPI002AA65723|nr:ELM1/GtrOC1 family putative glycosyltransferase [uncultured Desulfuromusa sp.]
MRILVLYDGKAGHLSQSLGVAQLIRSRLNSPVTIEQQVAKIRLKFLNRFIRKLALIPSSMLQRLVIHSYRWKIPEQKPDLIISFGGNVIALNVALAKLWKCNNVVIGNLYSINLKHIDAHITVFGDTAEAKAIASCVALCKVDPQVCAEKGNELRKQLPYSEYWAMLVGGNGAGYQYQASDWHRLGSSMNFLSKRYGIKWILTTSRRSGLEAEQILQQYLEPSVCAKSYLASQPESGSLEAILGSCDKLFCTEDSLSMLTESVSVEKPVTTLLPKQTSPKRVHSNTVKYMASTGLIKRVNIENLNEFMPQSYQPEKSYSEHLEDIYTQLISLLSQLDKECTDSVSINPGQPLLSIKGS